MAPVYVIIGTVFVGIMLSWIEYLGKSEGLELRTFMQVIKGLWLWLVVPLSVIFSGGILLKQFMKERCKEHKGLKWLRIVLMTLAVLVTLLVGFIRGIMYTFTSEMVTEKVDEDGYIVGTYSDFLSATQRKVYVPMYGIFRKPFEGWSETELSGQNSDQNPSRYQNEDTEFKAPELSDYDAYIDNYVENYEVECVPGDGQLRYRFVVLDAAAGSRMYGIIRSEDGGESWRMWSSMPFGEDWGGGINAVFLDENFGFATLSHNGWDETYLYVTVDGGISYTRAVMESYTVTLDDGYTYTPYDFPQMPYEEDGVIYVLCGQGADGDYDGGDRKLARYKSEDGGYTFSLADFVENEQWE